MTDVLIVTPARPGAQSGNAVTSERWAGILARLGMSVAVVDAYDGQPSDLLIALHARRSAESIERFAHDHPDRPIVVALTGTDLYADIATDAEARKSLELATRLVVLQDAAPDALAEHLRARTRVVYQSVDVPAGLGGPPQIGFDVCVIGHLRPVKDPFLTARAARLLPEDSRLRVIHLGQALTPEMEQEARTEQRENRRYDWRGGVPRAMALVILARSHLHVLTSRMEGGANVLGEAIVLGVPSLSTRIPGSIGMLGEEYPGYFPVGDERALADLLERAETEPRFLAGLRRKCLERADLFRPEHELASWNALLAELHLTEPERTG